MDDKENFNLQGALEVFFWNRPAGVEEKVLKETFSLTEEALQEGLKGWEAELSKEKRGFSLKKKGDRWILLPKKEYTAFAKNEVKRKKIPLEQREVLAFLFYEKELTLETLNKKRGKNSGSALKKLEKDGLVDFKEGLYRLSEQCREIFFKEDEQLKDG
jgi:chromosome segregation and condensation protein ScpB